jgi:hypothetical protein
LLCPSDDGPDQAEECTGNRKTRTTAAARLPDPTVNQKKMPWWFDHLVQGSKPHRR